MPPPDDVPPPDDPVTCEPWNRALAIELMHNADTLVAESGVSGFHPDIQCATRMVSVAYVLKDMETLRFALSEFTVTLRTVARRAPADEGE